MGINRFWKRLFLFAGVFIVSSVLSLAYTFTRPAIYEASADLLIEPKNPNNRGQDTSAYDIALQEQALLSRSLLANVLKNIPSMAYAEDLKALNFFSLQPMLHVTTRAESAIVRLTAEGPQKTILPVIVNTWVDCYVDINSQMQQSYSNTTASSLQQQMENLKDKIDAKRKELENFREKYDIVTLERDGNQVLSTLKGLNDSLHKTTENRTFAEANLQATKDAIEQGKWAGNYKKTTELLRLEEKAKAMEELVRGYEARYTPQFLEIDKNTRQIIDNYHRLEEEIQLKYTELQTTALEDAEQSIESAHHAEHNLRTQIVSYEKKASEFSAHFSEHESLKEDLKELEKLSRGYQNELVAMEIKSDADMLQVKVLERAFLPDIPSRPNYIRNAGISIVASLVLAIVSVLIFDLLTKPAVRQDEQAAYAVTYNQMLQSPSSQLPTAFPGASVNQSLLPMADEILPRELSDAEIKRLYKASNDIALRLIAGLFNGLSPEETFRLKWADINFDTGELKTSGDSARTVPLTTHHRSVLLKYLPVAANPEEYILKTERGVPLSLEIFEDSILQAASQAQIQESQQITTRALRHTYISYLARQGVPLSEIEKIVGWIPAHCHAAYQIMTPPGGGVSFETADLSFSTLQELS